MNALVAQPITAMAVNDPTIGYNPDHHFICDEGDVQSLLITIYPQDADKAVYTADVASEGVTPTTIPSVGDVAVFTQSGLMVDGAGPMPDVYVHQGAATCEIKTDGQGGDYKIPASSGAVAGGVTKDDAATWSAQAAVLCTDVFAAIGA